MKIHFQGQLSPSHRFAFYFRSIADRAQAAILRLALLMVVFGFLTSVSSMARPSTPSAMVARFDKGTHTWSVYVQLSCDLSSNAIIEVAPLYAAQPGFEGVDHGLSAAGTQVTISMRGPESQLPADSQVAILSVYDPQCEGLRQWMISTDGSGTILILDNF